MRKTMLAALALSSGALACQNYDFHRVEATPVSVIHDVATFGADAGTAYIMIVQDISGSMCETIVDAGGACAANPADSKLSQVAQDFKTVLQSVSDLDGGNPFYIGLTAFPESGGVNCSPPTAPVFPIASSTVNVPKIISWYAAATPNGGTPTADSLKLAGTDPALLTPQPGSSRYVLLVTDGYPNCNSDNPCATNPGANLWSDGKGHGCVSPGLEGTATPPAQCQCGNGACGDPQDQTSPDCCFPNQADPTIDPTYASDYCLDDTATDAAIAALYAQGITTLVVGVGTDFNGNYTVLDKMAQAGAGNTTATAYRADSEANLIAELQQIIGSLTATCAFTLSEPVASAALIEVTLDGTALTPGDATNGFVYTPATNEVDLGTVPCATVKNGQKHNVDITALGQP